jgi:hypothetical protein
MFACYANPRLPMSLDRQPVEGVGARVEGA